MRKSCTTITRVEPPAAGNDRFIATGLRPVLYAGRGQTAYTFGNICCTVGGQVVNVGGCQSSELQVDGSIQVEARRKYYEIDNNWSLDTVVLRAGSMHLTC